MSNTTKRFIGFLIVTAIYCSLLLFIFEVSGFERAVLVGLSLVMARQMFPSDPST